MKITKKQKQQLIDLNDSRVNEILNMTPELNKWYKATNSKFMIYLTKYKDDNKCEGFRFNTTGEYKGFGYNLGLHDCVKSTHQEVEQALTYEAKRRGFKEGAKFKSLSENGKIRTVSDETGMFYYIKENSLTTSTPKKEWNNKHNVQSDPTIFKDGVWAEIIDEKSELKQEIKELRLPYTRDKQEHEVFIIEELEDNKILVEFKNKERLILSKDCIVIE